MSDYFTQFYVDAIHAATEHIKERFEQPDYLSIYIIHVTLNTELNTLWCSGVFAKTTHLPQLQRNWLESPGLWECL